MAIIEKIFFKEDGIWSEYANLTLIVSKFKGSKRGISFISFEGYKRLTDDEIKGFCHNRFNANFVVNNIDMKGLALGQLLQIGDSVVKITKLEKDCLPDCPIIKDSGVSCAVNKQAFFAEILKKGLVNKKDKIILM
ncbi:hypothetical protein KQI88_01110 [Alkaliphilus sp. MSJ-5]|uniref:MOSC domain-containing protein n=1 Tax=Alkaliphilus flagellatus TaxID=2841507 RepID=A0ABS6G0X3_9FIRM|nr:hypothetical protein [Alkaliphilus flagellatus]MBU5675015.1 hypothetical protein [Alkaliphilus flagellatus]